MGSKGWLQNRRRGERDDRGSQFAWRAHEALQGWTAGVDAKASIVLIVEVAVAGAAVRSLLTVHHELSEAAGLHLVLTIFTLATLGLAVSCALGVVFPRLARRRSGGTSDGLLFFGDLRNQDVDEIQSRLTAMSGDEERRQLSAQLQVMSQIAWRKHSWLQASIVFLILGSIGLLLNLTVYPDSHPQREDQVPHQLFVHMAS